VSKNKEYIEAKGQVVPGASQAEVQYMKYPGCQDVHVCSKVAVNLAMDLSTSPHRAIWWKAQELAGSF
jgi:hypothetical protein